MCVCAFACAYVYVSKIGCVLEQIQASMKQKKSSIQDMLHGMLARAHKHTKHTLKYV
jgi:hypothetical protein